MARKSAKKKLRGHTNRILEIFEVADRCLKFNGKFNRRWRFYVARDCTGFPFSTLLTAFHKRYGTITPTSAAPQLQQQHYVAPLGDFPHNNNDESPNLDYDTVEEILRRLPLPSLIRAKSVCKAWKTAILDNTFNLNGDTHPFATQHRVEGFHGIAFFSTVLNSWFRIPLPWKSLKWDCAKRYRPRPTELYLYAAAAGLFLFVHWDSLMNPSPVIFSPATKQHKVLPPIPLDYFWMAETAVELVAHCGQFKIITIGLQDREHLCLLLYNSTTDKWTAIPPTNDVPMTGFNDVPHTGYYSPLWTSALHNGVVYFNNDFGHHLGCYDIACGEFQFKEIEGGLPPQMDCDDYRKNRNASLPSLVACSGKLLLVGRLQKKAGEASILGRFPFIKHTLVGIWELDLREENNKSWSLISITPRDLLEDTVKSSHGTDFVVAASDKIWLTIRGSMNLLTLDLSSMEWSVLPGCPAEDVVDYFPRRAVCGPLSIHNLSLLS